MLRLLRWNTLYRTAGYNPAGYNITIRNIGGPDHFQIHLPSDMMTLRRQQGIVGVRIYLSRVTRIIMQHCICEYLL